MLLKSVEFIKSSISVDECPSDDRCEVAFIGRSNVGKSSLINMLTNKKKLALTSSTPGKTKLINHFLIDNRWYLVDLPGYGYVKQSKKLRFQLSEIIENYILKRTNLYCLFVLIDIRHDPQKKDLAFMEWLGSNQIPFMIVFTKVDKIKNSNQFQKIKIYKNEMLKKWQKMPEYFLTSSVNKMGRDDILNKINSYLNEFEF